MNDKFPLRFFVVTFLWSWLIWMPLFLAGINVIAIDSTLIANLTTPMIVLGAFGPAIAAFFSLRTLKGKGEIGTFVKTFLSIKFGWKVWGAVVLIGIINLVSWYIPEMFGYERLPMLLPTVYIFPLYFLIMVFLGGGQEEIGWRGYILPFLEMKFGLWAGNIILGLVWSFWHLPLWFMSGASQEYLPFIAFTLGCIGLSFIFSWVIKVSGNRPLSGLVIHGAFNAFIPLFPTIVMQANVVQTRFWIQEIIILVVGSLFMYSMTRKA